MTTFNEIKQKLIDRVNTLANTASSPDVNMLTKTLDQVESNPRHMAKNRVNLDSTDLNEDGLDREQATQSTSTTEISPLGGGIHVQQQTRSDGQMGTYTNYENNKQIREDARPQFAVWSGHSNYSMGSISYDQYLRPYERKGYKDQGGHWHTGGDGGASAGVYSWNTLGNQGWNNNHCYLKTSTNAASGNTSTSEQHPSRTDAVGECGHYRIRLGQGGHPLVRGRDYGDKFRYENIEAGSCEIEHRQSYMKLQGKWIHLREKWMPGTHVTWASLDSWAYYEFKGSPTMYQVNMNETSGPAEAYGTMTYNKPRQEFTVIHQKADGANDYLMKIWQNVPKIDRLTVLEDVLKEENAVYVNFAWGSGWSSGSVEAQRCAKITMTDNGEVYGTMMNLNSGYYLGKVDNKWRVMANQVQGDRSSNVVYDIICTKPGTGYTSAPTLIIAAPGDTVNGTQATATCTVSDGRVIGTSVTGAGSYYDFSVEPHPTVTVDNSSAGGTGAEFVAVLSLKGSFSNLDSQTLNNPTYGRDSGPYGQRIVMSRDRRRVMHFCQYTGLGCGIRSFIIDKTKNAYAPGMSENDTSYGYTVSAFGEKDFVILDGQNWDDVDNDPRSSTNAHSVTIWYQVSPHDGTAASWKASQVGRHIDLMAHTTNYPCLVPIF